MDETPPPSRQPMSGAIVENHGALRDAERGGRLGRRLAWLVSWGTKGGLAVTDQALFAGAQFILNIFLARWLAPADYGAFAVAYSVFLLAAAVHSALLIEPMIVFGSGRYLKDRASYFGIVLRGHWLLTVPTLAIFVGSGFLVGRLYSPTVGRALMAIGCALPVVLLMYLARRAFYIELQPGRSAIGGAVYLSFVVALAWWLHSDRRLTPTSAIIAMGSAALVAVAVQLVCLRLRDLPSHEGLLSSTVASQHWGYGRWALGSALVVWVPLNVYYLALPAWFGLKAAGALKALFNLATPATHSLVAMGMLALPLLARHVHESGLPNMRRTARRIAALSLPAALLYLGILWLFRFDVFHLLYGGRYMSYSGLPVLLVGLAPLATACSVPFASALRACERPDRVFLSNLAGAVLAMTVGLTFAATWGITGALLGYIISNAATVSASIFFYRRLDLEPRAP